MKQGETAKMPDFEYFYGKKWKAYCADCGRCIWLIHNPKPDTCKWCGSAIKWEGDEE